MSWAVVTVAKPHRASRETTGTMRRETILARTVRGRRPYRTGWGERGPASLDADGVGVAAVCPEGGEGSGVGSPGSSAGGPACARRPRAM